MVGIPNDMLYTLSNSVQAAEKWVSKNISSHVSSGGVDIRYIAVGNESFLSTYNCTFESTTLPALQNIQSALIKSGLGNQVKVTVPMNADVYLSASDKPSDGDFRPDIHDLMLQIVKFLSQNNAPFIVNIYPFISLYSDANFPVDFAFFNGFQTPINDNGRIYDNVLDANHDTLVWALQKNGFGNLPIIVGEIGLHVMFPCRSIRPGPIDAYLFSLIDEDSKSIQPGNFERHWGIFYYDGKPKYLLNLGTRTNGLVGASGVAYLPKKWCVLKPSANLNSDQVAPSVSYACQSADCTSLGYGTSCRGLDIRGNLSYAFYSYYQVNDQIDSACKFPGLSVVTDNDPSTPNCKFIIMIQTDSAYYFRNWRTIWSLPIMIFVFLFPNIM
ncbi:hypothetical protein Lal_00039426 [Lupinus albus]|nr:hypothetical protein Lal_00039426 [Lupinus albus]